MRRYKSDNVVVFRRSRKKSGYYSRRRRQLPVTNRRFPIWLAVPIASLAFTGLPRAVLPGDTIDGVVTRVVDGDTLYLSGTDTSIRLWGLDAPERHQSDGLAATRTLRRLTEGRSLTCKKIDNDRYGRIVGQCFRSDGSDVTALMIRSGTAREYLRYSGGYYSMLAMAGGQERSRR